MIGRIEGQLVEIEGNLILLAVGGLGYEVEVTSGVIAGLPVTLPGRSLDQPAVVQLHTHFVVREDAQQLYGFASRAERDLFRALIRISGVGPKLALALLSSVTLSELAASVRARDTGVLTRVPGVGRKTAERLLVELKDKLPESLHELPVVRTRVGVAAEEAQRALESLGYRPVEAARMLADLTDEPADVPAGGFDGARAEDLVRAALQRAARRTEAAS